MLFFGESFKKILSCLKSALSYKSTVNFGTEYVFSKSLGSAFSKGTGPGPLYVSQYQKRRPLMEAATWRSSSKFTFYLWTVSPGLSELFCKRVILKILEILTKTSVVSFYFSNAVACGQRSWSCLPEVFCKYVVLKNVAKFVKVWKSLLNKDADLLSAACNFIY